MIRIVTDNINGLRMNKYYLEKLARERNPDYLCLQEIKASSLQVYQSHPVGLETYTVHVHARYIPPNCGEAVYCRKKPLRALHDIKSNIMINEGRFVCVEEESFFLVNVHIPQIGHGAVRLPEKIAAMTEVSEYCREKMKTKPVILCGDFNVSRYYDSAYGQSLNRSTPGFYLEERELFTALKKDCGFVDVVTEMYTEADLCQSFIDNGYEHISRCYTSDYILFPESLKGSIRKVEILTGYEFNGMHFPILCEFEI